MQADVRRPAFGPSPDVGQQMSLIVWKNGEQLGTAVQRVDTLDRVYGPSRLDINLGLLRWSRPKSIRPYQKDVPFLMVGDPKKAFYKEFGVETSLGFMSLKALGAGMLGMAHGHFGLRL